MTSKNFSKQRIIDFVSIVPIGQRCKLTTETHEAPECYKEYVDDLINNKFRNKANIDYKSTPKTEIYAFITMVL